jgi:HSP20 family protein
MNRIVPFNSKKGLGLVPGGLFKSFDDIFDDFFSGFNAPDQPRSFVPSVDMNDEEKEVVLTAELPGIDDKDIKLSVRGDHIILEGEKKTEKKSEKDGWKHVERSFGSFRRVLPLPAKVDDAKAKAEFKDGILTVHLPKTAPEEGAKNIAIKRIS